MNIYPRRTQALSCLAAVALVIASCTSDSSSEDSVAEKTSGGADATTTSDTTTDDTDTDTEAGTLTQSAYLGDYELVDDDHGASVIVTITDSERQLNSNGLPNHKTGEFPNAGNPNTISQQDFSASFPLSPTYAGNQTFAKEPGVTVAGVKLDPQTAERATCDNGVEYSIEALQDTVDLGLDFNNAHVQPTGAYHYHGVSEELLNSIDTDQDVVHIGFAYDGFMIYYSRSGAYKPSYQLGSEDRDGTNCVYDVRQTGEQLTFDGPTPDGSFVEDWEYVEGLGELDECNGIEIDGEYAYFMTDTYPYIGRCLNGEYEAQGPGGEGPPPGDTPPGR